MMTQCIDVCHIKIRSIRNLSWFQRTSCSDGIIKCVNGSLVASSVNIKLDRTIWCDHDKSWSAKPHAKISILIGLDSGQASSLHADSWKCFVVLLSIGFDQCVGIKTLVGHFKKLNIMLTGTPFLVKGLHEWRDGITWRTSRKEDFDHHRFTMNKVIIVQMMNLAVNVSDCKIRGKLSPEGKG